MTTPPTGHPSTGLDEVVHQKARLGILAVAHEAGRTDFTYLADTLHLTNGNLSGHLRVLEEAGMLTIEKGYTGRRPHTWITLTSNGRKALHAELHALHALLARIPLP